MNLFNDSFAFFVILTLFGIAFTVLAEERLFDKSGNALAAARLQSSQFVHWHIEQQQQRQREVLRRN